MKGRKIITVLIIVNLILVGIIYNLLNKVNLNNKKQIIKEMTEAEYENSIKSLNKSHEEYAKYIEESKTKIASAITDMGVTTSNEATPETMSSNIRSIARTASSISYDNTESGLDANNVQEVVDELNNNINKATEWKLVGTTTGTKPILIENANEIMLKYKVPSISGGDFYTAPFVPQIISEGFFRPMTTAIFDMVIIKAGDYYNLTMQKYIDTNVEYASETTIEWYVR